MKLILGNGEKLTPDEVLDKAAQGDMFAPKPKPKAPEGQADMFGAPSQTGKQVPSEVLRPDQKRTQSSQYYVGPRGGKWADPEHTIPWSGEGGGLEGQATIEAPGIQDVSRKEHENPALRAIVDKQSAALSQRMREATEAAQRRDVEAEYQLLAQAVTAATNAAAAYAALGDSQGEKDFLGYAERAKYRRDIAHGKLNPIIEGSPEAKANQQKRREEDAKHNKGWSSRQKKPKRTVKSFVDLEEYIAKSKEKIPGGLAAGKKPGDFDQTQLKMGIKVEMEHTPDKAKAREIAMDHLVEDSKYYSKLKVMESKPKTGTVKKSKPALGGGTIQSSPPVDRDPMPGAVVERAQVIRDYWKSNPRTGIAELAAFAKGCTPKTKKAVSPESPEDEEKMEADKEKQDQSDPPPIPGVEKSHGLSEWLQDNEETAMGKSDQMEDITMSGIDELANYGQEDEDLDKAQSMPEGNPKQKLGQGEEQGGKLAGVGMTSGSKDSAPGPGQDSSGQVKGSKTKKQKLSEDDEEDEKQMKEHKKPIEKTKKSEGSVRPLSVPQAQREQVSHEHALKVQELTKSEEDITTDGPRQEREPEPEMEKGRVGRQGLVSYTEDSDIAASELLKSDDFYSGGAPQVIPFSRPVGVGKVCPKCDAALSKSLTACPECGLGTTVHRILPGGEAQGDHDGEPIVKSRSGKLRPRIEKDVKFE